jgi:serine/threonine-protein kinase
MDSEEIHRRFLAERQILARLGHANIARLLDGGMSAEDQPYLAIEYVDGKAITVHCAERQLGLEARLRLFLEACEAVRYAHQHLVIHRDLKPSNILVTPDGQVKLLDFGIAKLLSQDAGATLGGLTATGVRVMTPEYASPEQVRGEPVTTATDVYALGLVLYELLTGDRAQRIEVIAPGDMERIVCQVIPEAPSRVTSGPFGSRLRGDLDTITLRAITKESDRRYPTVEQFSTDVQRHLAGLPVTARPDTWSYRAAKFVRRHWLGVLAGVAIVFSLMAGLAGTMWQARVAAARAQAASAEAAKERAVRDFLVRLFRAASPAQSLGRDLTARELLDRGRRDLDTALAAQPVVRSRLLTVVANVYGALGLAPQADTLFSQAIALARTLPGDLDADLATALTDWSANLIMQSQFDHAERLLTEAIARLRRRGWADAQLAEPLRVLGRVYTFTDRHARAEALLREALAINLLHHGPGSWQVANVSDDLGYELLEQGKLEAADSAIGVALAAWRQRLEPNHPTLLWTLSNLAAVRRAQGDDAEAERLLKEVLAGQRVIYPKGHSELAHTLTWLGSLLAKQGRYAEAESLTASGVAMHRPLLGGDNSHVAMLVENLAGFRYELGQLEAAERAQREVVGIWRRTLGESNRHTLAAIDELAVYLREQGRYREAEMLAREALDGRRRLLGDSHPDVAVSLRNLGTLKRLTGELDEAERLLREALDIERTTQGLGDLGAVLSQRGTPVEAESLLLEAYRAIGDRVDYGSRKQKREILGRLVDLYRKQGRPAEASKYERLIGTPDT